MQEIKMKMEDFLGKNLSDIEVINDTDFKSVKGYVLASQIIFYFGLNCIRLQPIIDTDELAVDFYVSENKSKINPKIPELLEYISASLTYTWNGINTNGYFDMFLLAFNYLKPSIMILSEGSVLKLFKIIPI